MAIIKFKRGIQQGLLGRISRHGLLEYHGFGIVSEGIESSHHCEFLVGSAVSELVLNRSLRHDLWCTGRLDPFYRPRPAKNALDA